MLTAQKTLERVKIPSLSEQECHRNREFLSYSSPTIRPRSATAGGATDGHSHLINVAPSLSTPLSTHSRTRPLQSARLIFASHPNRSLSLSPSHRERREDLCMERGELIENEWTPVATAPSSESTGCMGFGSAGLCKGLDSVSTNLQQAVEIGNAMTIASLSPNLRLSLCPDRKVSPREILDVQYRPNYDLG